jgi:hypothetical protein
MLFLMLACSEYEAPVDACVDAEQFILCDQEVTHEEAQYRCADMESVLVDSAVQMGYFDMDKIELVSALGELEFGQTVWWSGLNYPEHPEEVYVQSWLGAWNARDPSELHVFICEY